MLLCLIPPVVIQGMIMQGSILITGASTGIGFYCATELHRLGFKVIASCRKTDDVNKLVNLGLNCIQLDLRDTQSLEKALEQALSIADGQIGALFNNGAYGQPGALEDLSTKALREQFETNFFGWHELTRLVIPHMLRQGHGKIIQNSSVLGLVAMKYRGAYNASKFAVEGYTDTLRLELMDTPISISLIEPGPIISDFRKNARIKFDEHIDAALSRHNKSYQLMQKRLDKKNITSKYTLSEAAVLKPLLTILNSNNPKARYYVTRPTYVLGYLKRLLSSRRLDKILQKII